MVVTVSELREYEEKPGPIREEAKRRLNGWGPQCYKTQLRSFEVSSSDAQVPWTSRDVDDDNIEDWYNESQSSRSSTANGTPVSAAPGKLRLLYGKVNEKHFPFSREAFETISDKLDLSMRHMRILNSEHDSVMRLWNDRRTDQVCTTYCTRSAVFYDGGEHGYNYAVLYLFIHHNPTTHLTQGLLLQSDFIPHPEHLKYRPSYLEDIIESLRSNYRLAGHDPFFTATTLCKCALPLHQKIVIILSSRIGRLSQKLGHQGVDKDPVKELDFVEQTTKIQSHTQQLSILREMIERQLLVLGRIPEDTKTILKHCRENDGSPEAKKLEKLSNDVMDDVRMVAKGIETDNQALLKWVDREMLTVNSLGQMVYNYMALKETRITTELSKAARKDSSAMKTIAAVTMIFLPGTAIASILDTPFFVWDERLSKIITRQFWLFWAITIPITIAVVVVWRAAVYLSGTRWVRVLVYGKRKMKKEKENGVIEMEQRTHTNGSRQPKEPAKMV